MSLDCTCVKCNQPKSKYEGCEMEGGWMCWSCGRSDIEETMNVKINLALERIKLKQQNYDLAPIN